MTKEQTELDIKNRYSKSLFRTSKMAYCIAAAAGIFTLGGTIKDTHKINALYNAQIIIQHANAIESSKVLVEERDRSEQLVLPYVSDKIKPYLDKINKIQEKSVRTSSLLNAIGAIDDEIKTIESQPEYVAQLEKIAKINSLFPKRIYTIIAASVLSFAGLGYSQYRLKKGMDRELETLRRHTTSS